MENFLQQVTELFHAEYGYSADTEVPVVECDADGMVWHKTAGTGPLLYG